MLSPLPIDAYLPNVISAVKSVASTIIKAAPGTGKTTRIPPALISEISGRILVLEPRRLAAKLSALRIASEIGEDVGQTCGYQVRYDSQLSDKTRILFVTEGIFTKFLIDTPKLEGIGAVIIDEFHERHLHTDLALAMVSRLIAGDRPDLKLIVMSATIDTQGLESYLQDPKILIVEGQTFPVTTEHLLRTADKELPLSGRDLEDRIVNATLQMLQDPRCTGNILVFSSGLQEIRKLEQALKARLSADNFAVLPLAADLSAHEQTKVFTPSNHRKIVIATNVAETSVTIPGITGVIDPGLAKIAGHASWSGLPTLEIRKISQASAIQRAGRAGRTAPGLAYRLYSEADFRARSAFSSPEIRRLDLTGLTLEVKMILNDSQHAALSLDQAIPWLDSPDQRSVYAAQSLLTQLGALGSNHRLTEIGKQLARLPLGPRLGAIMVCGRELRVGEISTLAAVLMSERLVGGRSRNPVSAAHDCDLLYTIEQLQTLDPTIRNRVEQLYRQVARQLGISPQLPSIKNLSPQALLDFSRSLLAGFPDRVAKRRELDSNKSANINRMKLYNLCLGRGAILSEATVVRDADWLIALEASESLNNLSADRSTLILSASKIDPSLLSLAPGTLSVRRHEIRWVDDAERVDAFDSEFYGQLCVSRDRSRIVSIEATQVEELLCTKLAERWPKPFADDADLKSYHARLDFLTSNGIVSNLPEFKDEMFQLLLSSICEGKRSFKEINSRELADYIEDQMSYEENQCFARLAPLAITNRNGRKLKVYYESGKHPWTEGMIQDFYGMTATPKLLDGRLPLTIHLLAPNKRPIQVTSDLVGFWRNSYPDLKRELCRRYPRHFWPDDPIAASPHLHLPRR